MGKINELIEKKIIFTIEDIRNKLTPINNLVKMIENDIDRKWILKQLPHVKESIKYLSQKNDKSKNDL